MNKISSVDEQHATITLMSVPLFSLTFFPPPHTHRMVKRFNEASRSYSGTPHSVGILQFSDQPDAERPIPNNTTLTRDSHVIGGDSNPNPSKRATADPRLRPPGHRDRP